MTIETAPAPLTRAERRAAEKKPNSRKKVIVAGIAAALLAPGAFLGAILTDHASVDGHTVAKDALKIDVTGQKLITIAHALPGSSDTASITITNSGTAEADVVGSYTVAAGQDLLDAGQADLEFTGVDGWPGPTGAHTSWTGSHWEIDDLQPGQSFTVTLTLTYDSALDSATWDALASSASFAIDVDGQQAANPGSGVSWPSISWLG